MPLTTQQKQAFKAQAHRLRPVVILGSKGLTHAVLAEIDRALIDHELIKIKLAGGDREQRQADIDQICETLGAEKVQTIGAIGVLYRANPIEE
jgi:RNA-binding protein